MRTFVGRVRGTVVRGELLAQRRKAAVWIGHRVTVVRRHAQVHPFAK